MNKLKIILIIFASLIVAISIGIAAMFVFLPRFIANPEPTHTPYTQLSPHIPISGNVHNDVVSGNSMSPTIKDGQKMQYVLMKPIPGDIIIFVHESDLCQFEYAFNVKRLTKIREEDQAYWVEGDNKSNSCDSRQYGWIKQGDMIFNGVVTSIDGKQVN